MKKRIIASFLLFLLLFIFAWQLDKKGKPDFYVPELEEEVVEVIPTNYKEEQLQKKRLKAFQSREYVRVIAS